MGLDVSHDAFHGAYSAFNRLRHSWAEAAGGKMTDNVTEGTGSYTYLTETFATPDEEAGFVEIMGHSDCDGEISPEMCAKVADALQRILPNVSEVHGGGHLDRAGGVRRSTERFIAGCREAHEAGERLEFG
jgi:hypothetical protein